MGLRCVLSSLFQSYLINPLSYPLASLFPLPPSLLPPLSHQPGLQCVDLVFDELLRMAAQCETTELTRFPELRDRVVEVVNHMLRKCVGPTQVI